MLFNSKGKVVHVQRGVQGHTPKGQPRWHDIAVLAPLREVLVPTAGHRDGKLFKLGTRARMVQA